MNLGSTIAVFLIVAALLMALFCLLTKYYNYRLRKERRKVVQLAASENSNQNLSNQVIQGAYRQFKQKEEQKKLAQQSQIIIDQLHSNAPSELREILEISNNIYGLSSIRQRLNSDTLPLQSETHRSMISLKEFTISRLNTAQSHREPKLYTYVKKLIAYDENGLKISQVQAESIKKIGSQFKLDKKIENYIVSEDADNFLDMLDAHGFCIDDFGYYKYIHTIDVTELKNAETKQIKVLQNTISKEMIKEEEYSNLRYNMLSFA